MVLFCLQKKVGGKKYPPKLNVRTALSNPNIQVQPTIPSSATSNSAPDKVGTRNDSIIKKKF